MKYFFHLYNENNTIYFIRLLGGSNDVLFFSTPKVTLNAQWMHTNASDSNFNPEAKLFMSKRLHLHKVLLQFRQLACSLSFLPNHAITDGDTFSHLCKEITLSFLIFTYIDTWQFFLFFFFILDCDIIQNTLSCS